VDAAHVGPYDEWGRLTRFLESSRLAFARERNLWASLGIDEPEQVRISVPAHERCYVIRDAFAHGSRTIDDAARTRRLLSLLNLGGIRR
jgi:hypothetical protein